jgi:hypothetical protein
MQLQKLVGTHASGSTASAAVLYIAGFFLNVFS